MMKKITTQLFLLFLIITFFNVSKLQAQNCFISLSQPLYGANGNVVITGQASYPIGWYSNIDVNYGDGSINTNIYNQTSLNLYHTYLANGSYTINANILAFNPSDSTQSCFTSAVITVSITNVSNTCNLQTSLSFYEVSQNTINILANANIPVINEYLTIDGQQIPYADSTFYTFTQSGQHQICYYASSADSLNPCSDTACTIYDNTNNNTNCNLQAYVNVTPISSDVAQITGYASSTYNYSYISIDGQLFSGNDTMTYTFNIVGQHQICYYASYQDSTAFCADSSCVLFTSGGGSLNCQASFYIWQDSLNSNTTVWLGINNSTGTPPFTYAWDFGDGTSSTQAYPVHVFNTPGNYIICLQITDATGCTSSMCDSSALLRLTQLAQIGSLTIYPPGTTVTLNENQFLENIQLVPNPADEFTHLNFVSKQNEELEIEVSNLFGAILYGVKTNCQPGKNEYKIPTADLSTGYFLLKIKKGKSRPIVLKLIRR